MEGKTEKLVERKIASKKVADDSSALHFLKNKRRLLNSVTCHLLSVQQTLLVSHSYHIDSAYTNSHICCNEVH